LDECEKKGVDVQVLSTVPVMFSYWAQAKDTLDLSRLLNDNIAEVVSSAPNRFIGLGTLPMQDADFAIQELERCVGELQLPGIQIGTNIHGKNLSDPLLFPVFESASDLGAALFIHPWDMMAEDQMQQYWLPWLVGMPAETSRAICSLIFGGVLEKLPNLRIAFAHGGGSFPATAGRVSHGFKVRPDLCAIDTAIDPSEYLGKFWVDSLVHDADAFEFLLKKVGENKIILGSDYPFPLGEDVPGELVQSIAEISDETKYKILGSNAFDWLGISSDGFTS
jgi:aminocarboxymuconate-semialdehyde decarboxylase